MKSYHLQQHGWTQGYYVSEISHMEKGKYYTILLRCDT